MSGSQRKDGRRVAVQEVSVREALTTGTAALSSEEERVVRMRHGASGGREMVLEAKATGGVLLDLRRLELELHQRYAAHRSQPSPQPSEAKDRIVRALRRKR